MTTQRHRPAPRRHVSPLFALALAVGPALAADPPAAPAAAAAAPPAAVDQATQNSQKWPLATTKALILAMTNSSDRAIAVGERGIVLTSASRQDWQQVDNVPTRSTLTAVTAVGNQVWAVGHDGTIIHSADGGGTWTRQRSSPYVPGSDDPHNGTPLLGVLFSDDKHGFAVGAYAQLLRTDDGGENWTSVDVVKHEGGDTAAAKSGGDNWTFKQEDLQVSDEADPHINGIAKLDRDTFLMVGERGTAFRSVDGGQNWRRLKLPYKGSMFGILAYDSRHALAYGLRGHVLETRDQGDSWTEVATGTELSLMGGAAVGDGGAVLVGANGVVLMRNTSNEKFALTTNADGGVLAAVLPLANAANAELVVSGENGIGRYASTTPEGKP